MEIIYARNVCDAYSEGLHRLRSHGVEENSRAGRVLVMPTPVVTVYNRPTERVLLDERRDANPFFHLFEALWMLAGRSDVKFLDRYLGDFGQRYAESNGALHDAYGHRWRTAFGFDQLRSVTDKLVKNPQDRQAVLQMWDCTTNGLHGYERQGARDGMNDLEGDWKSRPCNLVVAFRARAVHKTPDEFGFAMDEPVLDRYELDMTVFCRSNDAIWGTYGANAVHMSVMHEYVASAAGMRVGRYYQVSNNFHAYVPVLEKHWPPEAVRDSGKLGTLPLFSEDADAVQFDTDLMNCLAWIELGSRATDRCRYSHSWFEFVADPMARAHAAFKRGELLGAREEARGIEAADWRAACTEWLDRRIRSRLKLDTSELGDKADRSGGGGR